MKRNILFACLLIAVNTNAQYFKGSITWTITFTMPDTSMNQAVKLIYPNELTIRADGKNWLLGIRQAAFTQETIWLGDSIASYRVNRNARTYTRLIKDAGESKLPDSLQPLAIKTKETMVIQGYTCYKYISPPNSRDNSLQQVFWVAPSLRVKDLEKLPGLDGQPVIYKNMDGLPLRVEIISNSIRLLVAAKEINKGAIAAGSIAIPRGFTATEPEKE